MKRTEMLNIIAWRIRDIRKYDCSEMEIAVGLLAEIEKAGMLPPSTDNKCSDPELSISPLYFEEYVPQRIILGWDDE